MTSHRDRERRVDRTDREESRREAPRQSKPLPLNDYWIDGEGINREVLQIEICKYLGAEATCRPGDYNGRRGYRIKALRPFTPQMLEDLKVASEDYISENRGARAHGYEETSYIGSQTRQRRDNNNGYAPAESRFPQSSETNNGGYPYPGPSYPASSGYPIDSGYPAGGYSIGGPSAGYPAMVDGQRYNAGYAPYPPNGSIDYPPSSGYGYVPGPMYGEQGQPPRGEPRIPSGYIYSSAPDIQGRTAPVENRHRPDGFYETPFPQPSMGRGGDIYGVPQRGGQPSPYSGIAAEYPPTEHPGGRYGRR